MDRLIKIIESPSESFLVTLAGTLLGYTPLLSNSLLNLSKTNIDRGFQHTVWAFTIFVAILAIVSSIQKQIDRYKLKHKDKSKTKTKTKNKSLYGSTVDDDDEITID